MAGNKSMTGGRVIDLSKIKPAGASRGTRARNDSPVACRQFPWQVPPPAFRRGACGGAKHTGIHRGLGGHGVTCSQGSQKPVANRMPSGNCQGRSSNPYVPGTHFPSMVLQWHLTAKCDQNCLHCYVHDGRTYQRELQNELTHKQCIKVVDDYVAMCDTLGRSIRRINFTGGDPLLRPDFFDILAYARGKGIVTGILGNPNHLDYPTAVKLKGLGLSSYQVSIDGMEETHDRFRGRKGLFKDTVRALRLLNEIGINSHVMFTLSRENAHELVDVIRTVVRERVRVFNFDRVVPIGSGEQYGGQQMMTPQESKDVLLKAFSEYTYYQSQGCFTRLGMKDKFWYLLLYELGLLDPARDAYPGIDLGCKIGKEIITVVADGTVMSCRRLPVPLGKVPGQSLLDVFRNAPLHKSFLKEKDIKKCGKCELLHFCKGCPAVAYASCGDFMGADPQCWKQR